MQRSMATLAMGRFQGGEFKVFNAQTIIIAQNKIPVSLKCGASVIALGIAGIGMTPALAQSGAPILATSLQATAQSDDPQNQQLQSPSDQAAENQAEADDDNVIVVTGFRESLRGAQAIKKNSNVIVDSVTAEDIGALPDRSVTETLQRIPGVSIDRFSAGRDPDHFAVEGSGVTIRGLSYTGSRFNGRDAFTAGNGTGLNFADVPSELLAGVDVFKTPTADMIEGGIGGIVNLRTRLPLDQKGMVLAGSLEMNYGDFAKKGAPTASILASKTWDTGIGEIGLLGSFSYSKLFSRADRIAISSFRPRTLYSDGTRTDVLPFDGATAQGSVLFPRGAVLGRQDFDRERYGYSAAAQWRSNDGTLEATAQFIRSDARQTWGERVLEIATDNVASFGDSRAVAGTSINLDDSGRFESGFITAPTGWRDDQQTDDVRTPYLGLQSNNIARTHYENIKTDDYSFNLQWTPTDRFALRFDYQHVNSRTLLKDNSLWTSSYQDAYLQLNGKDLPTVQFQPPQNCADPACPGPEGSNGGTPGYDLDDHPSYFGAGHMSYADPFNTFYRSAMDHLEDSDGNEDAFRLDGEFSFPDSGFLKSIQVGGRYADTKQTARFSIYNWGVLSEQWGNGGPVWLDDNVDGIQGGNGGSPADHVVFGQFDNFFRGQAVNPVAGSGRYYYDGDTVNNQDEYNAFASMIAREWQGTTTCADGRTVNVGWNPLAERCGNVAGTPFQPGEINPQSSQNWAAYASANFDSDFSNGWSLTGNVGLRYTHTRRRSDGFFQISSVPVSAPDCTNNPEQNGFCVIPDALNMANTFLNGYTNPINSDLTYDYFLPSVNAKLDIGGGVQFRAGYFRGVFNPPFGFARNYFIVNSVSAPAVVDPTTGQVVPGQFFLQANAQAGNPNLKPTRSDNFDLTAEYYFSNVGQLTVAAFYKRLYGVVVSNTNEVQYTNNGVTLPGVLAFPENSTDVGTIKGFEVSYQQTYDFLPGFLSGLGLQATYTFVDSNGVPQTTLNPTNPNVSAGNVSAVPGDSFQLQGLSRHTVNVTPFIDVGPLSLRASYNWRSRYLLTLRDEITPFDPIFQDSYGQLDASAFVTVNDNFKIGVQGVNLLNSVTRTEAAVLDAAGDIQYVPRQWYLSDRRFTIVTRINF